MIEKYKKIFIKAKKEYFNLGFLVCPALENTIIYFSDKGFTHLLYKGVIERELKDRIRRLQLVRFIRHVVTSKNTVVLTGKRDHHIALEIKITDSLKVKIIIEKRTDNSLHFLSIMDIK